jgi:RNA polymerase sigma-70 factor, ECF subfamily
MDEPAGTAAKDDFDRVIAELRPKLHRYCARMTGSVIEAEDVVQDTIVKALEALARGEAIARPEGWLFRIAHNTALDLLRRRAREQDRRSEEGPEMIIDPLAAADRRQVVAASLRTFLRLPAAQRSSVVLMDVIGYSLQEISEITEMSIPAIKAALHRGRERLRELAAEPEDRRLPALEEPERSRLKRYADRFNARDFDAVRDMLAEEVKLEVVGVTRLHGRKEVGSRYFYNYSRRRDWTLVPGLVDGRPAALVKDPADPLGLPAYFILLDWAGNGIVAIRDFAHVRYAIEGAEIVWDGEGR